MNKVLFGIDNFIYDDVGEIKGKKIGLVSNNSSRNFELESSFEILSKKLPEIKINILAPEHGYFGELQAGQTYESRTDDLLGVKIISLYSKRGNKEKDIDSSMRSIDSSQDVELPGIYEALEDIDLIIYDLQDVGCRVYTYISTLINLLNVAHKNGLELILLDRPNPLSGIGINGPILENELRSFVGNIKIPLKHNLTLGEIALYHLMENDMDSGFLKIIKMKGWKRRYWYDEIGTPWVPPSPNLPTLDVATVYPGMVLLEGTNVSEGRGTTRPFLNFGAPWINPDKIKRGVEETIEGQAKLVTIKYIPTFSKYAGQVVKGLSIYVTDRKKLNQFSLIVSILRSLIDNDNNFEFYSHYFDRVAGTKKLRDMLLKGYEVDEILEKFKDELDRFEENEREILLYD